MTAGTLYKFALPSLVDDDSEDTPSLISINFGSAQTFVSGSFPSYTLAPSAKHVGIYTVSIKVKDDNVNPMSATYSFTIEVQKGSDDSSSDNSTANSTDSSSNSTSNSNFSGVDTDSSD